MAHPIARSRGRVSFRGGRRGGLNADLHPNRVPPALLARFSVGTTELTDEREAFPVDLRA